MRGEDKASVADAKIADGSPPHARGRLLNEVKNHWIYRITPACAGKTFSILETGREERDHPRMRGEDLSQHPLCRGSEGSPPHARGRPTSFVIRRSFFGITPACAGKTIPQ